MSGKAGTMVATARPRPTRPYEYPEVSEFMVRRLTGEITPALNAAPDSGVRYDGVEEQWMESDDIKEQGDIDQIYESCIEARDALVTTANKFCKRRKLPPLEHTAVHSWTEVEASVMETCETLEKFASEDNTAKPGFTGKFKGAFRKLCEHSGVGTTLAQLVPSDSYGSVLCGGLTIIFTAMQSSDLYRKEIQRALEDLPMILNDHAAMIDLNRKDETLHERAAALYAAIFKLMEVIFAWFLQRSITKGAKFLINKQGYSTQLLDKVADVKLAAQSFSRYTAVLASKANRHVIQQNYTLMSMQGHGMERQDKQSQKILGGIEEIKSRIEILEMFAPVLGGQMAAVVERERSRYLSFGRRSRGPSPVMAVDIDEELERYQFEKDLVPHDIQALLRTPNIPGYDMDEDRVQNIQSQPRFKAWLTLDESSMIFINANSETPTGVEMSFISAKTMQMALQIASRTTREAARVVPLAFFCSQHRDFQRDANACATEMIISLLLQLLNQYRDFDPEIVREALDELDPDDLESIVYALDFLISQLPRQVIVMVIVDGLRFFSHPAERRDETIEAVGYLVQLFRGEKSSTLKLLFASPTRCDFLDHLFYDDEKLNIPREPAVGGGYSTKAWDRPIEMSLPELELGSSDSE